MNTEQKAKAYDEALKRAREWSETKNGYYTPKELCEEIFPELKESEDEMIRKELIEYFRWNVQQILNNFDNKKVLAWLEKQGKQEQLYIRFGEIPTNEKSKIYQGEIEVGNENGVSVYPAFKTSEGNIILGLSLPITKTTLYTQQHLIEYDNRPCYLVKGDYVGKDTDGQYLINNVSIIEKIGTYRVKEKKQDEQKPTDKSESKFNVGDWIACEELNTAKIISINVDRYEVEFIDGTKGFPHIDYIDRNFHLWTIQDAKEGDVLCCESGWTCIFKCLHDNLFDSHCFMDAEGWFCEDGGQAHTLDNRICGEIHPATKEQRDQLEKAMADAGYEWDAEKKELKKINKNTDVGHEYFSDLLEKDDCDNIDDYAYQCAYCMSHDWMKETATWEDVQKAVKLGAEWNERHHNSSWSEEDISKVQRICKYLNEVKKYYADINEVRECMEWLKSLEDRVLPQPKQKWKQENTDDLTDFENAMMHIGESFFGKNAGLDPNDTNTIKEQANTLLGLVPSKDWSEEDAVNFNLVYTYVPDNSLRDWLKELKDRVQPQSKQEWSEDDVYNSKLILATVSQDQDLSLETKDKLTSWFKSLKPQNHWKPSDEQIKALHDLNLTGNISYAGQGQVLIELYNDLKKLREE